MRRFQDLTNMTLVRIMWIDGSNEFQHFPRGVVTLEWHGAACQYFRIKVFPYKKK